MSTAVGGLGATALGDPQALGLDAAFPALFLALLWPPATRAARGRRDRGLHAGTAKPVNTWVVVALVGAATVAIKAAGPVLIGGRQLPPRALGAIRLLAPALLAALVVTQAVGASDGPAMDERLLGLAAAVLALVLRAPILVVVLAAAATTALARLIA